MVINSRAILASRAIAPSDATSFGKVTEEAVIKLAPFADCQCVQGSSINKEAHTRPPRGDPIIVKKEVVGDIWASHEKA